MAYENLEAIRQLLGLNIGSPIPKYVVDRLTRLLTGVQEGRKTLQAPRVPTVLDSPAPPASP